MTASLFREPTLPPEVPGQTAMEPELDLDAPTAEAPYGYTRDPDGTVRPKKTAGRQRRPTPGAPPKATPGLPPSIDALKAAKEAEPKAKAKPKEDVAPAAPAKGAAKGPAMKAAPEPRGPFRAGPIAKGMNRIYKRAGKIIRTWDPEVGMAVIVCATKEDEDDVTVGEAWEELARVNPRIRAFLEKMISGGAWGSLIAAHMPIVLAFLMKDAVRQRFPLMGLVSNLMGPDDDGEDGGMPGSLADMMAGMGPEDMTQIFAMAQGMMGGLAAQMPRDPAGPPRAPGPVVDQSGQAVA